MNSVKRLLSVVEGHAREALAESDRLRKHKKHPSYAEIGVLRNALGAIRGLVRSEIKDLEDESQLPPG